MERVTALPYAFLPHIRIENDDPALASYAYLGEAG